MKKLLILILALFIVLPSYAVPLKVNKIIKEANDSCIHLIKVGNRPSDFFACNYTFFNNQTNYTNDWYTLKEYDVAYIYKLLENNFQPADIAKAGLDVATQTAYVSFSTVFREYTRRFSQGNLIFGQNEVDVFLYGRK